VLSSLRDKLQQQGTIDYLSLTIAAWFRYLNGQDDQGHPITVDDPMADLLIQRARSGRLDPQPLLSLSELFGDLCQSSQFVATVTNHLHNLYEIGAQATVAQITHAASAQSISQD
jgi:mannitol 2-dehydrogenase